MFFPALMAMFAHYVEAVHVTVFGAAEFAAFFAPVVMTFKTMAKPA